MSIGSVAKVFGSSATDPVSGPLQASGGFSAAMLEALLRGNPKAVEETSGGADEKALDGPSDADRLTEALAAFTKEASKTVGERAKDQILKKHNLSEAAYEALRADRKLEIDREIADRVQLLMQTDGKKSSKQDDDERAAAAAAATAAATAEAVTQQQTVYPSASFPTAASGFVAPLGSIALSR